MRSGVHIVNGDSTLEILQKSGLEGATIVWREMLCDGPVCEDVGSDKFWMQRYEFYRSKLNVDKLSYYDKVIKELVVIEDLSNYNEVVLWFEYDLFCQINLLAACSYLLKYYRKDISYHLVCVGKQKNSNELLTLADYPFSEYPKLYEDKKKLSRNDLLFADECWKIYASGNQELLENFDFSSNGKFDYLNRAMKQHKMNQEKVRGLDFVNAKILSIINENSHDRRSIIKELLLWQRKETVNGFGDLQYGLRLDDLCSYYDIVNNSYKLNEKGLQIVN